MNTLCFRPNNGFTYIGSRSDFTAKLLRPYFPVVLPFQASKGRFLHNQSFKEEC
jgi:hypothetical protein